MRSILWTVALAAGVTFAATAAEPEITQLGWLAGCWQSDSAEAGSGEQWTPIAGGTMLGMSRTVKQGRTVEFEFMQLRHLPDGRLAFIAMPSGQRPAVFPLARISAGEAVFENPQHDFPQRIVYGRVGEARLRARIEGTVDGAPRVIEFPMTRVSCDSQLRGPVEPGQGGPAGARTWTTTGRADRCA